MIQAKWIWRTIANSDGYNEYLTARRQVVLPRLESARILVAADSWYRLHINGSWVNDGPCRSWSHHAQYDVLDITSLLVEGANEVTILCRHFGCGVFQRDPIRGGLLAQIDAVALDGREIVVGTDASWEMGLCPSYLVEMPKVGLGMEPFEAFDARRRAWDFAPAEVVAESESGPWRNLAPRDVALLTRKPVAFRGFLGAKVVEPLWQGFTFSLVRLLYPGLKEGGGFTTMAAAAATVVMADEECAVRIESYPKAEGPTITLNGEVCHERPMTLRKGLNLLLLLFEPWGHHNKDQGARLVSDAALRLQNPTDGNEREVWDFVPFTELLYHEQDGLVRPYNHPERNAVRKRVDARYAEVSRNVKGPDDFRRLLSPRRLQHNGRWPVPNPHWQFECRKVLADGADLVERPEGALKTGTTAAVVRPSGLGDIELCYDLGEQNCGYYEFEVEASEGTVLDLFGVEYICAQRGIQHTWSNKNGLRYICAEGANNHLSVKRRSGRYLYLTIRNQVGPVRIRRIGLVESTYPVQPVGEFRCSDQRLNEIWEICERTLKLCMEDVFTDCPLYEQTMWVGDARNEGLFAMVAYRDVSDIIKRCIRLAAQSLETYPFIPSHAPTSSAEAFLPAWSFLWGVSVWDYHYYSGDTEFLREIWPDVLANLRGLEKWKDKHGLFRGPFWNMFDWTGVDSGHEVVTHNSMLLKGSLDALARCAEVLGDAEALAWIQSWARDLAGAIDLLWVEGKASYVDSIHEDGTLSESTCIHTNFLSLLYDVAPDERREAALRNVLTPPEGMVTMGSPFAMLYLYEALDKLGRPDDILRSIQSSYRVMLDVGATTVWEQFADGNAYNPEGFPTRSHCHAWSSSPILYLNLLVLGIRQTGIGGRSYVISPRVNMVDFAHGASASIRGLVAVSWFKKGGYVEIEVRAPEGVECSFCWNETMAGFGVKWNGTVLAEPRRLEVKPEAPSQA